MQKKGKNVTALYFEAENPLTNRRPQNWETFKRNLNAEVTIKMNTITGGETLVKRKLGDFYPLHGRIPSIFLFSQLTGLELYVGYPLSIMAIDGILHLATIIRNQLCLFEVPKLDYHVLKKIESNSIPQEQQDKTTYRVITDEITENMVEALKGKKLYSFYGSEVFGGVH